MTRSIRLRTVLAVLALATPRAAGGESCGDGLGGYIASGEVNRVFVPVPDEIDLQYAVAAALVGRSVRRRTP